MIEMDEGFKANIGCPSRQWSVSPLRPNPNSKSSPVPGGPAAFKAKKVMTGKLNLGQEKGGVERALLLALLGKVSWSLAPWPVTPSAATQGSSVSQLVQVKAGIYFFSRARWFWAGRVVSAASDLLPIRVHICPLSLELGV